MKKGISPFISAVLLVMISISAIYLALSVIKPTIDRAYESADMNEADQNLQILDNSIREVASEGTGSMRNVLLKVSEGDYRVINTSGYFIGAVQYMIDLKYSPFYTQTIKKVGNVKYSVGFSQIGLVNYWKLDEGNGNAVVDSGGNNYGFLTSGTNWIAGKFGNAINFSADTSMINFSSNNIYLSGNGFTIEAWTYFPLPTVVGGYREMTYGSGYRFVAVNPNGDLGTLSASGIFYGFGYNVSSLSGWHHIVMTFPGDEFYFYVDGVYVGHNNFLSSTAIQYIGNEPSGQRNWGPIDEVRIYERALTADEIMENYNAKASDYQAVLEYSNIVLTGTAKFGKGDHTVCIEKIGELGGNPLIGINAC